MCLKINLILDHMLSETDKHEHIKFGIYVIPPGGTSYLTIKIKIIYI